MNRISVEITLPVDVLFRSNVDTLDSFSFKVEEARLMIPRVDKYGVPERPYEEAREFLEWVGIDHSNLNNFDEITVGDSGDDTSEHLVLRASIPEDEFDRLVEVCESNDFNIREVDDTQR